MTTLQNMALNEMGRQGLHLVAKRAEQCWDVGREFSLDTSVAVPRELRHLLDQCNREVTNQERWA